MTTSLEVPRLRTAATHVRAGASWRRDAQPTLDRNSCKAASCSRARSRRGREGSYRSRSAAAPGATACTRRGREQSRRRRAGAGVGVLLTDGVSRLPPPGTPRLPSARAPTASYVPRAGAAVPAGQAMAMREREINFEGPTVHGSVLGVLSKGTAGNVSRRGKRSGDWRGTLTICGNHDRTNPIRRSETPRGGRYFIYRPPRLRPGQCHWQHGRLTAASMSSPQSGSPRRVLQLPMEMVRLSAASIASIDAVDAGGARVSTDGCTSTRVYWWTRSTTGKAHHRPAVQAARTRLSITAWTPRATLHARDVGRRRRWTRPHRQPALTATTEAASLYHGAHLVERGERVAGQ